MKKREQRTVTLTVPLPLKVMWSPDPAEPKSIGMGINDASVKMKSSETQEVVGEVMACLGGGIMITFGKGDQQWTYGLAMGDLWNAINAEHEKLNGGQT